MRSDQRLLQEKEEFGFDFRRKISVSQLVVRLGFLDLTIQVDLQNVRDICFKRLLN